MGLGTGSMASGLMTLLSCGLTEEATAAAEAVAAAAGSSDAAAAAPAAADCSSLGCSALKL